MNQNQQLYDTLEGLARDFGNDRSKLPKILDFAQARGIAGYRGQLPKLEENVKFGEASAAAPTAPGSMLDRIDFGYEWESVSTDDRGGVYTLLHPELIRTWQASSDVNLLQDALDVVMARVFASYATHAVTATASALSAATFGGGALDLTDSALTIKKALEDTVEEIYLQTGGGGAPVIYCSRAAVLAMSRLDEFRTGEYLGAGVRSDDTVVGAQAGTPDNIVRTWLRGNLGADLIVEDYITRSGGANGYAAGTNMFVGFTGRNGCVETLHPGAYNASTADIFSVDTSEVNGAGIRPGTVQVMACGSYKVQSFGGNAVKGRKFSLTL